MQGCGCYITLMFVNLVLIFTSVSLSSGLLIFYKSFKHYCFIWRHSKHKLCGKFERNVHRNLRKFRKNDSVNVCWFLRISALPFSRIYRENDDLQTINGPYGKEKKLDSSYESLGRLLWTNTDSSNSNLPWLIHLQRARSSKLDLVIDVVNRLEEEVRNLKDNNRWNRYKEINNLGVHNPAGSGVSFTDRSSGSFLLNKRTSDNANVLMCLLCSQSTYLCDARRLVRACYPSRGTHRIEWTSK